MQSYYQIDRKFTDYVHKNLAIPQIYNKYNLNQINENKLEKEKKDIEDGIDYTFKKNNKIFTFQERIRESKYKNYNDFTLRYKRDYNRDKTKKYSEYFKIKADFLLYAVVNGNKSYLHSNKNFLKFAIINLNNLFNEIKKNNIIILNNGKNKSILNKNNVIECPIKENNDFSSSFVVFEIPLFKKIYGDSIIYKSFGYN